MEIRLLLEKYKNLGYSQNKIREITQDILKKNNIFIETGDMVVKDFEIRLNISGVKKTEFILQKSKIQEELLLEFKKEGFSIKEIF